MVEKRNMRKILPLFVLVLILLQSFSKVGVYLSFRVNQTYIAKTLCINKAKPELRCNGKCYLAKKLKQAEEQEQKQNASKLPQLVLGFHPLPTFCFLRTSQLINPSLASFYLPSLVQTFPMGIFHPPQA